MTETTVQTIARQIAELVDARRKDLTCAWLDELRARLRVSPERIFPDETLLNHIPDVLREFARAVRASSDPTASELVRRELKSLAELRRDQGYALEELILEFDLLRRVVFDAILDEVERLERLAAPADVIRATLRLQEGLTGMVRLTTEYFHEATAGRRRDRGDLLRNFGRAVSHELRNRIHTCLLLVRGLRERAGTGDAEAAEALERLELSLHHMTEVAGDVYLVAVSRHSAASEGAIQMLDELVADTIEIVSELAEHTDVELRTGALPQLPVDAPRVQLALVNLLTNAIKYSDPSKSERWVEVRARPSTRNNGEWRLDVVDNGVGIPTRLQERIFDENVRASESEDLSDGEGMGLPLAREAVMQLGGRLWVASEPGKGSTFSFTLREPRHRIE
jgi:signal transduction histidine kinase